MARVERDHGRLHVLVNAAGIEIEKTVEQTSLEEWNRIFAINVTGTFLTSKHALPLMRRAGGGSIVNFGSYDGFFADPNLAAYCATKGAVHALTRAMACDHGPENVRVNAICPGYIDTPMLKSFFDAIDDAERLREEARRVHPMRRYGTPEDVANLVNWLAGDEARYASGQLWVLDGGLSAPSPADAGLSERTSAPSHRGDGAAARALGPVPARPPARRHRQRGVPAPGDRRLAARGAGSNDAAMRFFTNDSLVPRRFR